MPPKALLNGSERTPGKGIFLTPNSEIPKRGRSKCGRTQKQATLPVRRRNKQPCPSFSWCFCFLAVFLAMKFLGLSGYLLLIFQGF